MDFGFTARECYAILKAIAALSEENDRNKEMWVSRLNEIDKLKAKIEQLEAENAMLKGTDGINE